MQRSIAFAIPFVVFITAAFAGTTLDEARKCFDRYVTLEAAFDPAVADLYSDEARIQNTRTYPNGLKRVNTMPAPKYKQLIRQAMPLAKQRGDSSTYSEVRLNDEGGRVRINATRFSNLKKYSSPISLLVGPGPDGTWLIFEELSESQP